MKHPQFAPNSLSTNLNNSFYTILAYVVWRYTNDVQSDPGGSWVGKDGKTYTYNDLLNWVDKNTLTPVNVIYLASPGSDSQYEMIIAPDAPVSGGNCPPKSCPAGTVPSPVNLLKNGGFATAPSSTDVNKHPGKNNTTVGYFYSAANFYSQAQYRGYNTYPTDWPAAAGDGGTVNKFSIMEGEFYKVIDGYRLNQKPFPGDPSNNVPATNYWLYSNGNALKGAEYLVWEQDISGLTTGKNYVFSTYVSNISEDDAPDDPVIRLKQGGTTGMPTGTGSDWFGPLTLKESDSVNSKPLNGWVRLESLFSPTSTGTMRFKLTSAAKDVYGDDLGLTAVGVHECITPSASLVISKSVTGDKPSGFVSPDYTLNLACSNATYNRTVKLKDGANTVITDIPSGVTCSLTETLPAPPVGYTYAAPVISPDFVTLNNSNPSAINVTNTLSWKTGSLKVTKQVIDKPAGFTSPDYAIAVDCSNDSFDQTVLLKDGASKLISGIPENTTCTVSEPTLPTAPTDSAIPAIHR